MAKFARRVQRQRLKRHGYACEREAHRRQTVESTPVQGTMTSATRRKTDHHTQEGPIVLHAGRHDG